MVNLSGQDLLLELHVTFIESLANLFIIMKGNDIGNSMLPAVVDDNRTIAVYTLGQMIDHLGEMLLHGLGLNLAYAPGLVERGPGDDAGMIVVLMNDLEPFSGKLFYCIIGILIGGSHLAPYQHALHIAPVQETLVLNLLMFPEAVVTQGMDLVDILDQCLLAGRCQMRILPVTLIQDQPLIQRMTVQEDIGTIDTDLSHGKIGTNRIQNLTVSHYLKCDVVKIRALRTPGSYAPLHTTVGLAVCFVVNIHFCLHMIGGHDRHGLADQHISKGNGSNHHKIFIELTFRNIQLILKLQCHIMKIRSHFHMFQTDLGYILCPDSLPDTGGLYIPTTEILIDPALFSTGLLNIEGIFHFNDQFVLAILHKLCDIKGKTGITALMITGISTVYP